MRQDFEETSNGDEGGEPLLDDLDNDAFGMLEQPEQTPVEGFFDLVDDRTCGAIIGAEVGAAELAEKSCQLFRLGFKLVGDEAVVPGCHNGPVQSLCELVSQLDEPTQYLLHHLWSGFVLLREEARNRFIPC